MVMALPPPEATGPSPVSPETETPALNGKLRTRQVKWGGSTIDAVLTARDPTMVAFAWRFKWSEISGVMFPD